MTIVSARPRDCGAQLFVRVNYQSSQGDRPPRISEGSSRQGLALATQILHQRDFTNLWEILLRERSAGAELTDALGAVAPRVTANPTYRENRVTLLAHHRLHRLSENRLSTHARVDPATRQGAARVQLRE